MNRDEQRMFRDLHEQVIAQGVLLLACERELRHLRVWCALVMCVVAAEILWVVLR